VPPTKTRDHGPLIPVLIVAGLSILLAVVVIGSTLFNAAATNKLASVLDRRTPTLEHLACHESATDAFLIAQKHVIDALLGESKARTSGDPVAKAKAAAALDKARAEYDRAEDRLTATSDPNAPLWTGRGDTSPSRCPYLPTGSDTTENPLGTRKEP